LVVRVRGTSLEFHRLFFHQNIVGRLDCSHSQIEWRRATASLLNLWPPFRTDSKYFEENLTRVVHDPVISIVFASEEDERSEHS
ncbi:hypothetical protein PENTCL1PPCAC_9645, partial [Pristionchus entomophagus]